MTARDLAPDLQRTAAYARMRAAKEQFTKASVAVLRSAPNAEEQVTAALAELTDSRAELAALNADEERSA